MEALAAGLAGRERAPRVLVRRSATDERLVAAVRAGSEDAFAVVFDRYHRRILSFCRHMLGSREESEDAVQATFLSAYRDLVGSEKPIQLRPWLYAIARNHCLSVLRARRESASLDDVEPSVDGLAAEVQRRADLRDLLADLARLPDDQRAALVLSEVGDLSHEDVAGILDCPREKVKGLVFQARTSLAASRSARDTPCEEIRAQLSTLSGAALRRRTLRRHLRDCAGCRAFQAEVKRQRAAMAVLLPVVPTVALRSSVLGAVRAGRAGGAAGLGGTAAAGGGGAIVAGGGAATGGVGAVLGSGAAKVLIAAALVAGGAGGGVAVTESGGGGHTRAHSTPAHPAAAHARGGSVTTGRSTTVPAGFAPTRAHGQQAPGRQGHGVANGRRTARGEHGHSGTALGRAGTSPGKAGTSPGKARTTPGQAGTAPGQTHVHPAPSPNANSETGSSGSGGVGTHGVGAPVTDELAGNGKAVANGKSVLGDH
jgi:RNA polymerase sigma factor (sigma-70 family)